MAIRINNIALNIDEDVRKDKACLYKKAAKKLRINEREIESLRILRESIDARRKNDIKFKYSIEVDCAKEEHIVKKLNDRDVVLEPVIHKHKIMPGNEVIEHRPVVIGMGPAGMFAALTLAQHGYKPLVIERGENVEKRSKTVDTFWKYGILNTESNVQFGEGGAGTFSDGKLTTRIKDRRCDYVLKEFVNAGAPHDIIYSGKPHVGTDILKDVVKNIREQIISLGGEILFSKRLEDIKIKDGKMKSIIVNGVEVPCEILVLAIGHSSRDTYEMLYKNGIMMEPKPFAIGVRVEHLQRLMDENQYGKYADHPRLRASDYRLAYNNKASGRSAYSFCMCPGGVVVAAASEDERLVVNGMSYHARDKANANSAIVVNVGPKDFEGNDPLSGMRFQRHYESLAYKAGGGGYKAPVQLIRDFMNDEVTKKIGNVEPSYRPGYEFRDMRDVLPSYVCDTLKEGFMDFERKIHGFASGDGVMTGIETRTSAPLRIMRNDGLESVSIDGMYPCGEGAGFAGGIISAAVDGVKCAEKIIEKCRLKMNK